MKKIISYCAFVLLLASCATQTYSIDANNKREVPASPNPHFSKTSHFFLEGVGQSDFQNASKLCADSGGVAFVEAKQTVGQVFLTAITYHIYSPRTMNIYCNK